MTGMKVGRYISQGKTLYFFSIDHRTVDSHALAKMRGHRSFPKRVANALNSGVSADWVASLPYLEEFLLACVDQLPEHTSVIPPELESPVQPQTIICIGLNYRDHAQESSMELPKHPLLFSKSPNSINGHNREILLPRTATQVDYEAELGVVIGSTSKRVAAERAEQVIAGYLCANDVSARDFQFADGQWFRGKSADGFAPLGPWLVTVPEIVDPGNLRIQLRLNGSVMQDATTADLIFGIPELIEWVTQSITLHPGDVILTGTPPGVGFARKPPVFLRAGDQMEVEIERIGTLANTVVEDVDQPD